MVGKRTPSDGFVVSASEGFAGEQYSPKGCSVNRGKQPTFKVGGKLTWVLIGE